MLIDPNSLLKEHWLIQLSYHPWLAICTSGLIPCKSSSRRIFDCGYWRGQLSKNRFEEYFCRIKVPMKETASRMIPMMKVKVSWDELGMTNIRKEGSCHPLSVQRVYSGRFFSITFWLPSWSNSTAGDRVLNLYVDDLMHSPVMDSPFSQRWKDSWESIKSLNMYTWIFKHLHFFDYSSWHNLKSWRHWLFRQ